MPNHAMTVGTNFWRISLGIGAFFLLLCTGAMAFLFHEFPEGSNDPATIDAARDEMAKLHLPVGFFPITLARFGDITCVGYWNYDIDGRITLTECVLKSGNSDIEVRKYLAEEHSEAHLSTEPLVDAERHTKQIRIKGQQYPFEFTRGTDPTTHEVRRRVSGGFAGNRAATLIEFEIEVNESAYHEDHIVKMLEGIR
jgi:hypothetical protein